MPDGCDLRDPPTSGRYRIDELTCERSGQRTMHYTAFIDRDEGLPDSHGWWEPPVCMGVTAEVHEAGA
jgi:hypothetical protein